MLTNDTVAVHPRELEQVVGAVFTTMLGLAAEPGVNRDWPPRAGLVTAAVSMAGGWKGAVLLHCLPRQACEFAGQFLSMPPSDAVDNDVRDVMGELANMIAGNLKCTLCPGIQLSTPVVVEGSDYSVRLCHGKMVYGSAFATDNGPFWLSVYDTGGEQNIAPQFSEPSADPSLSIT